MDDNQQNNSLDGQVPDFLEQNEIVRTMADAKALLTRRTNTFQALINGRQQYTRQDLVTARTHMLAACENLTAELDNYVALGLNQQRATYIDGRNRERECLEHFGDIYDARLRDFVDADSVASAAQHAAFSVNGSSARRSVAPSQRSAAQGS